MTDDDAHRRLSELLNRRADRPTATTGLRTGREAFDAVRTAAPSSPDHQPEATAVAHTTAAIEDLALVCPDCAGSGSDGTCQLCAGSGEVLASELVDELTATRGLADRLQSDLGHLRTAFRVPDELDAATLAPAEGWRRFCAETWRPQERSPRSDSLRNRLSALVDLLGMVGDELDDLHVLAYERPTRSREVAVGGGQPDYALDHHGDERARTAYRELALATVHAADVLATAADDVVRLLRAGDDPDRRRTARRVNALELAESIDARARRLDEGSWTPVRRYPQPELETSVRRVRSELDQARKALQRRPTDAEIAMLERLLDAIDDGWGRPGGWPPAPLSAERRHLRAAVKRTRE